MVGESDAAAISADEVLGRTVLGRYRIVKRLARGGMGVVYLARTEGAAGFTRPAVVKRILPDLTGDDKMTQMFVREARIMSYLHHPSIVGVLDFGEEDNAYIMVLEYVHGFHLGRWYRYAHAAHGSFSAAAAIHLMIKVLGALHYAHTLTRPDGASLNIVHRDISPSNILLDCDGNVKLADFGIARVAGETQVFKTEETTVKGKFPYLAPELFTGHPATVQTDIYSCGVVLHELLLGRNDFRGREIAETIHRVFTHTPDLSYAKRPEVPSGIEDVLKRALAKSPAERFLTAGEFAAALREIREQPEDLAQKHLRESIRRDFLGDMPNKLGCEPLQALDSAWRESEVGPSRPPVKFANEMGIDVDLDEDSEAGGRRRKKSNPWPFIAATMLILAVGGVTYALTRKNASNNDAANKPKVIVVERQPGANATGSIDSNGLVPVNETKEAREDTTSARGAESEVGTPKAKNNRKKKAPQRSNSDRKPKNRSAALTASFAKRRGSVRSCFQTHTKSLEGTPRIFIRFSVNEAGSVTRAELLPASVGRTPLGKCLAKVAKGTDFGRQPESVSFRIPIQAQVTGG